MNGNSVKGNLHMIGRGTRVTLQDMKQTPEVEGRIYSIEWVNKLSSDYKNSRRFIVVDWEESFKLQGQKDAWKKEILAVKEKELYALKRKIKFPTNESYSQAVEMGEESGEFDYIVYLEGDIEKIKALKKATTRKKKAETEAPKVESEVNEGNNE
jgi:hypothetical protein